MLRIRIVVTAAILIAAVSAAAAQTATGAAPGKPLPLLQILQKPAQAAPEHRIKIDHRHVARMARQRHGRTHLAVAKEVAAPAPTPTPVVPETAPANVWPAANIAPPIASAPPPATDVAVPAPDPNPSALAAGNQGVPVASPIAVNDSGVAAGKPDGAADPAPKGDAATPTPAPTAAPFTPAPQTASVTAAPRAALVAAAPSENNVDPVGSPAWIAKVLAALGGAITAGVVAWFMIGAMPQRTYG